MVSHIDAVSTAIGKAVSYLLFVMIAIISYEVVARYFFNSPTTWVQDVSGWLQVGYIFLGGAYALQRGYLVRVDVLYVRFSPRGKAIVDLTLSTLLFCCFAAVLLWKGFDFAMASYRMGETSASGLWNGPYYPAKFLVPIGTALLCLAWLAQVFRGILTLLGEEEPAK